VRFPVEFEMFMDAAHPDTLKPEFLPDFDRALDEILAAGLAVIVDWHAREDTKLRLRTDDAFVDAATRVWRAMAKHLAARDPDRVFLETMNEPAGMELPRWWRVQGGFVAAIRAALPHSTIIVSPYQWGGLDEMVKTTPYADDNIVYNFHFYEPMVFTHQSAAWPGMGLEPIRNLAYPVTQASLKANLARVGDGKGRAFLQDYHADRAWVAARFRIAADWAAAHHVPITCNEFGVYTAATPKADRYRWIRDVREICGQLGIGWSMWDYAGGFAVTSDTTPGHRQLDPKCLQALGLKPARE
jgi:aryl-phospho-beta-D-glucosidase BglC (GH1 family)